MSAIPQVGAFLGGSLHKAANLQGTYLVSFKNASLSHKMVEYGVQFVRYTLVAD